MHTVLPRIFLDIWQLGFLQRAFLAGLVVAAVCPAVGLFLVVRRLSLLGDCLAHVSLAGAALGLAVGVNANLGAMLAALGAATGLEYLRRAYGRQADLALAVTMAGGVGVAAVLTGLGRVNLTVVMGYLFGSLVAVNREELLLIAMIGGAVAVTLFVFYHKLFYLALDEEGARAAGIPAGPLSLCYLLLAGAAVSLTMRLVGALLLASLLTLPAACALALAQSFRQALLLSIAFAETATVAGLVLAYYLGTAPGGTIVLSAIGLLLLVLCFKPLMLYYRRRKQEGE
ncbi:MAG: metal ABC transporter permease [Clostridia bacterium]|nr:metal ABC transporter permease [Clostridia bacterium]